MIPTSMNIVSLRIQASLDKEGECFSTPRNTKGQPSRGFPHRTLYQKWISLSIAGLVFLSVFLESSVTMPVEHLEKEATAWTKSTPPFLVQALLWQLRLQRTGVKGSGIRRSSHRPRSTSRRRYPGRVRPTQRFPRGSQGHFASPALISACHESMTREFSSGRLAPKRLASSTQ